MRNLNQYRIREWSTLTPVAHLFKQLRNDMVSYLYKKRTTEEYPEDLNRAKSSIDKNRNRNLVISIAFGKESLAKLQIDQFSKHIDDAMLVIADNSPSKEAKETIRKLCHKHNVIYFSLPSNKTPHANRSHSLALEWCYKNIIIPLNPNIFGFIDHDIAPVCPFRITSKPFDSTIYGLVWNSTINDSWQLWAGYCFFKHQETKQSGLNFMYDFANGLDTGGRCYSYYKTLNRDEVEDIPNQLSTLETKHREYSFQIIDNCWPHMAGAGHKQGFSERFTEFMAFIDQLEAHPGWELNESLFKKTEEIQH